MCVQIEQGKINYKHRRAEAQRQNSTSSGEPPESRLLILSPLRRDGFAIGSLAGWPRRTLAYSLSLAPWLARSSSVRPACSPGRSLVPLPTRTLAARPARSPVRSFARPPGWPPARSTARPAVRSPGRSAARAPARPRLLFESFGRRCARRLGAAAGLRESMADYVRMCNLVECLSASSQTHVHRQLTCIVYLLRSSATPERFRRNSACLSALISLSVGRPRE